MFTVYGNAAMDWSFNWACNSPGPRCFWNHMRSFSRLKRIKATLCVLMVRSGAHLGGADGAVSPGKRWDQAWTLKKAMWRVCVYVCVRTHVRKWREMGSVVVFFWVCLLWRGGVCEFPRWRPRFPSCKFLESGLNLVSSTRKTTTRDSGWISCFSIGVCVCLWTGRINYSGVSPLLPVLLCWLLNSTKKSSYSR